MTLSHDLVNFKRKGSRYKLHGKNKKSAMQISIVANFEATGVKMSELRAI